MFNFLIVSFIFLFSPASNNSFNNEYIESELHQLNKLIKKGVFEKGAIFRYGDTLYVDILKFQKNRKQNAFLFCVTKNSNDSIIVYKANELDGYIIGNDFYKGHTSGNDYFFIKRCKKGRINLYERNSIPSDNRFLYYFVIPGYSNYFIINPFEQNITTTTIRGSNNSNDNFPSKDIYESKQINEKFKVFIYQYLNDCPQIKIKIESEFYTINNIPEIVEMYNNGTLKGHSLQS